MQKTKTAILLSGGMDSIALAHWQRPKYSITIDYGQKPARAEINAASQISRCLEMEHHIIRVDCSQLGSGDMNGTKPLSVAPVTEWWPYRNQLLVTLACMKILTLGITELIVGSVLTDTCHKDGTKQFYQYLSDLIKFQEGGIKISSPAIDMTTTQLIKEAKLPTSLLMYAHSCHTSNEPCMNCNGCNKYLHTLQALKLD